MQFILRVSRPLFTSLAVLLPASVNVALAADSYVTRIPARGEHFRVAQSSDPSPGGSGCTVYVPAYSNIYLFESGSIPLAINLSIRNTDASHPVFINKISYYAANGALVEAVLTQSWILAPMATATYVIDQHDMRGGDGANFLVEWRASSHTSSPLVETVMAGYRGSKGLGFSSRGVPTGGCTNP